MVEHTAENRGVAGSIPALATTAGMPLLDIEQEEDACYDGGVQDQAEDGHGVVGVALVRRRISRQWWKHAEQPVSPRRIPRVEVVHLPEQRTPLG